MITRLHISCKHLQENSLSPKFQTMCFRPVETLSAANVVDEISELKLGFEDKTTTAFEGMVKLVRNGGRPVEPLVLPLLPSILKALSDKVSSLNIPALDTTTGTVRAFCTGGGFRPPMLQPSRLQLQLERALCFRWPSALHQWHFFYPLLFLTISPT